MDIYLKEPCNRNIGLIIHLEYFKYIILLNYNEFSLKTISFFDVYTILLKVVNCVKYKILFLGRNSIIVTIN